MTDFIQPISANKTPGWTVKIIRSIPIFGKVRMVKITHPKFGALSYGQRPEGYDSIVYEQEGGVVTLPYCFIEGELFVLGIEENRLNLGGPTISAIGGFGESMHPTVRQAVEASEEAGIDTSTAVMLAGHGVTNRALSLAQSPETREKFFAMQFEPTLSDWEQVDERTYLQVSDRKSLHLIHWQKASEEVIDMHFQTLLAKTLGYIAKKGLLTFHLAEAKKEKV